MREESPTLTRAYNIAMEAESKNSKSLGGSELISESSGVHAVNLGSCKHCERVGHQEGMTAALRQHNAIIVASLATLLLAAGLPKLKDF